MVGSCGRPLCGLLAVFRSHKLLPPEPRHPAGLETVPVGVRLAALARGPRGGAQALCFVIKVTGREGA